MTSRLRSPSQSCRSAVQPVSPQRRRCSVDAQCEHAGDQHDSLGFFHTSHLHHLTALHALACTLYLFAASGESSLTTSRKRSIRVGSLTSCRNTTDEGVIRITSPSRTLSPMRMR